MFSLPIQNSSRRLRKVNRLPRRLTSITGLKAKLGDKLSSKLKKRVEGITEEKKTYLGVIIQNILQRKLIDEIGEYFESSVKTLKMTSIRLNLLPIKKRLQLSKGENLVSAAKEQQTASLLVRNRYIRWPFEGSFWKDDKELSK